MSTYPIDDLLHRWDRRALTPEQAIGHLLQHVETLTQRLEATEKTIRQLEQQLATRK